MSKPKTDKEWQERNPEKVKKYIQKYMQDKERVVLTLNKSTLAKIDRVKPEGQKYATWITHFLEEWESTQDRV